MELNLGQAYDLTTVAAQTVNTETVNVVYTADYGTDTKKVESLVRFPDGNSKALILWEGADYDAAGDWTEADKDARIIQLLTV